MGATKENKNKGVWQTALLNFHNQIWICFERIMTRSFKSQRNHKIMQMSTSNWGPKASMRNIGHGCHKILSLGLSLSLPKPMLFVFLFRFKATLIAIFDRNHDE